MSAVFEPKNPSVPEEPYYPPDRLWLFDRHDRASWERASGEQAPPWDQTRRPKHWADTSVLNGVQNPDTAFVEYDYLDMNTRTFKKMKMTAREAATPNLPGPYIYPEYIIAPTLAVIKNPEGGENPLNPIMLCHYQEAKELAQELGADSVIENRFERFVVDWRGDERRIWLIRMGTRLLSAGLLLQRKYAKGVGAPGQWVFSDQGLPSWVSLKAATGEDDHRPEVPVPSRPLADNEALYTGHPMKVVVYRTDMESDYNQAETEAGAFPMELRLTLERIDSNLQQLLALSLVKQGQSWG